MNKKIQSLLKNSWVDLLFRWVLGGTFVYASFHKIIAPAEFAKIIYGYDLFPNILINLIAINLPFIELFAGLALITGIFHRSASLVINSMLLAFIIALSINLIRGHEFDCGCFSSGQSNAPFAVQLLLFRDLLLLVTGVHVYFFTGKRVLSFSNSP